MEGKVLGEEGVEEAAQLSGPSGVPFLGHFHQLAPRDPCWQQFIDENPNQMRPSCGAKASLLKRDRLEAVWGKNKFGNSTKEP